MLRGHDFGQFAKAMIFLNFSDKKVPMKTSFSKLIKSKPRVLVDFYADWCGPCKMLTPILGQVKEELGDHIRIAKIDVDKNPKIAGRYQVRGVPTMILFKDGKQVWRQSGVVQKSELINIINSH